MLGPELDLVVRAGLESTVVVALGIKGLQQWGGVGRGLSLTVTAGSPHVCVCTLRRKLCSLCHPSPIRLQAPESLSQCRLMRQQSPRASLLERGPQFAPPTPAPHRLWPEEAKDVSVSFASCSLHVLGVEVGQKRKSLRKCVNLSWPRLKKTQPPPIHQK